MLVGMPKEIHPNEYRAGLQPAAAIELQHHGHRVLVQQGAGVAAGWSDEDYAAMGAEIGETAAEVYARADLLVKVMAPEAGEWPLLKARHVLFCFLHLAVDAQLTQALLSSGCVAIGYEAVRHPHGGLPLMVSTSEVAGRMAVHVAAQCLERHLGGSGMLLGGVVGVPGAKVVILGGGVAGSNAARAAVGMGARVTVLDRSLSRLDELDIRFGQSIRTVFSTYQSIETEVASADVVIGAVLMPGAKSPKLVSRDTVGRMKPGSVIVDLAIDHGGCIETSRPTTHANPTFIVDNVVHYCVSNITSAVSQTSATALCHATLPYILTLATEGWEEALRQDPYFREGLLLCRGKVTDRAVSDAWDLGYVPPEYLLGLGGARAAAEAGGLPGSQAS
jgi:alanine dehydrogenase